MKYDGMIRIGTKVDDKQAKSRLKGLGSSIMKIGAMIGVAFGVRALINFSRESQKLYKEQLVQETKLATVIRQRMNATDEEIKQFYELASAQQKIGVLGDEVQMAGMQMVSTFLTQKESLEMLLPAMNNLIVQQYGLEATSRSAESVAKQVGRAFSEGSLSMLKRTGISVSKTQEEMFKYANELEKAEMLTEIITENVGDMNQALAKTDAGRQQQLANAWGDTKEEFGQAFLRLSVLFIPMLQKITDFLSTIGSQFVAIANVISGAVGDVSKGSLEATKQQEDLKKSLDDTAQAGENALGGLSKFDKFNSLKTGSESEEETISFGSGGTGIGEEVTSISGGMQTFVDFMQNEFSPVFNKTKEVLEDIGNLANKVNEDFLKPLVAMFVDKILPAYQKVSEAMMSLWSEVIYPIAEKLYEIFKPFAEIILEHIVETITFLYELLAEVITFIVAVFQGDWETAWESIGNIVGLVKEYILGYIDNIKEYFTEFLAVVNGFVAKFKEVFGSIANGIGEKLENGFKGIFNNLMKLFENFLNDWVGGLNSIIREANKLKIVNPFNDEIIVGFNIPTISEISLPRLANGAVIPANNEFLAVLGDQKSGRNIETPEKLLREIVQQESGTGNINVVLELDGYELCRKTIPVMKDMLNAEGSKL